jgi:hypothetical protein
MFSFHDDLLLRFTFDSYSSNSRRPTTSLKMKYTDDDDDDDCGTSCTVRQCSILWNVKENKLIKCVYAF